jgi:hypothetical protein
MGDTEQDHCRLIANKVLQILQKYVCNVFLVPKFSGTELQILSKVVDSSNFFVNNNQADMSYHLDIHTDAGYAGSGASGFYVSEAGKAFILQIYREIAKITPWEDGTVRERNLYVLKHTQAIAGLIEVSFHDDLLQAKWVHDNVDAIASAIVKGLENATGIKKVIEPQHWAEESYQKLVGAGYEINDRRFDDALTRAEYFVLEAQKIK